MKKRILLVFCILILGALILNIVKVNAVETKWCAEKTTDGKWCQNVALENVDQNYRKAQTSCDSTSFCRLGTCVDSSQGLCSPNTPQQVCQNNGGVWTEGKPEEITQCQLGCCLLGDEASFVTQARCKALSSNYGLETNYRTDIKTEAVCIASASPQVKGACVFDDGFSRNCRMLTKSSCQNLEASSGNTSVEFHEGFLCSAESLATNCGKSQKTTIIDNKDEVYFLDTCGNVANIYNASKVNNQDYWTKIKSKEESCNPDSSNAGSSTCGNCNYQLGSIGKAYQRGNSQTPTSPQYGDYVCADLSCKYNGQNYQHGETWCSTNTKKGTNESLPGSESYRLVCYNGEVNIEQCAAFRQEICVQGSIETNNGEFSTASCRANLWRDCTSQDNKADCENREQRDCQWREGQSLLRDDDGTLLVISNDEELIPSGSDDAKKTQTGILFGGIPVYEETGAACLPLYAPGLDFWDANETSNELDITPTKLCAQASDNCIVKFGKGIGDVLTGSGWNCEENCECLGLKKGEGPEKINKNNDWVEGRNAMCVALGDCGASENYLGIEGYHNKDAVIVNEDYGKG